MKIIDITQILSNQTIPWEGENNPKFDQTVSIKDGADYNVTQINTNAHIGTHIDAPKHFLDNGKTIEQIPLEKLIGKIFLIELPSDIKVIDHQVIEALWKSNPKLNEYQKILFKTKNSENEFGKDGFNRSYTALDTSGAQAIVEKNIHFIGIDYHSISIYEDIIEPHKILLEKEIVILEGAQLKGLIQGEYELYCLPLKIKGSDGAPVRAILLQQE